MTEPHTSGTSGERPPAELDDFGSGLPDSVRLYLNSIPKELLTPEEEVEKAKRIEAGLFAERILYISDVTQPAEERALVEKELCERYVEVKLQGLETLDDTSDAFREAVECHTNAFRNMVATLIGTPEDRSLLQEAVLEGRQARRELTVHNLRLVVDLAKRRQRNRDAAKEPFLDAIQNGNQGLLRAVDLFDYTAGYKFSTYATSHIRGAMSKGGHRLEHVVHLSARDAERLDTLRAEISELQASGRNPSVEELAREMELKPEDITMLLAYEQNGARVLSLDTPVDEYDTESTLGDFIEGSNASTAEEGVDDNLMRAQFHKLLATLSGEDLALLMERYNFRNKDQTPLPYKQVAERLGKGGPFVENRLNALLDMMQHPLFDRNGVFDSEVAGQEWRRRALCRRVGGAVFMTGYGREACFARQVCNVCPVKLNCLRFFVEAAPQYGVWAGYRVAGRRTAGKARPLAAAELGTLTEEATEEAVA